MNNLAAKILITTLLSAIVSACGGGSEGGSGGETGTLSLNVTDAPIGNVTSVFVEFTGVTLKPASGPAIEFMFEDNPDTPDVDEGSKIIDLLALQGMASQPLLEDVEVPAGQYNQIRLHVNAEFDGFDDSYVVIDNDDTKTQELGIPSGSKNGLKLNTPFTVAAGTGDVSVGEESVYTIDFNLAKSVINPDGQAGYFLKPVLRLVQNIETGSIGGTVHSDLMNGCSGPSVYAYSDFGADLGDVGGADEPLTTALVALNDDTDDYEYEIGYLNAGEYTIAFTCEADIDTGDDEDIVFLSAAADKEVLAGDKVDHDFLP